ncbi:MAG: 1-deoxy-D-xylulose-5-phosphate synthase [Clostridiales bacterium]|nr:1-deoxy-D-xylulose-5-phosphate synthase [Clostridiales bacterium]
MNKYLTGHNFPQDLKDMSYDELELLSYELRDYLVETVSETGGHLSSNLGVVEITIALHKVFDTPADKLIWDVGHQTYIHKILTGRGDRLKTVRQFNGMSGFPKSSDSPYDVFDTGHSSTSLSLGLGMAEARDLAGEDYQVVSIIGDGALTGGLSFEALNNAGNRSTKLIIVLNDNGMSISPNTGGLSKHLSRLRSSGRYISMKEKIKKNVSKIPVIGEGMVTGMQHARDSIKYAVIDGILFEELGIKYFGPIDGHDIETLCKAFEWAKQTEGPVLIHTITQKGKGYSVAENNPNVFHGIGPFNVETGQLLKKSIKPSYSYVMGNKLIEMAQRDPKIVAVSAAMLEGTGLEKFSAEFPERTFDVGIAEAYAVSFAAGLAKAGSKPFVAIYSTFLQRGYDQIVEDVCLQNLPVVFCIDRAGIVGADGETHHGILDLSYLKSIPNLTIMAPKDKGELEAMMEYAITLNAPCAIRYPKGATPELGAVNKVITGKANQIKRGTDVEIWALGSMVEKALKAADILKKKNISVSVINAKFLKPFDTERLLKSAGKYKLLVSMEDNALTSGMGEEMNTILKDEDVSIINIGWPDKFIEHGSCGQLYEKYGLDPNSVAERIAKTLEG